MKGLVAGESLMETLMKAIPGFIRARCAANAVCGWLQNQSLVAIDFGGSSLGRGRSEFFRPSLIDFPLPAYLAEIAAGDEEVWRFNVNVYKPAPDLASTSQAAKGPNFSGLSIQAPIAGRY